MRQTTLNELRQKSNPFACAQVSVIATGQTLQLTKKRKIIAFFSYFLNPNPFTACHVEK